MMRGLRRLTCLALLIGGWSRPGDCDRTAASALVEQARQAVAAGELALAETLWTRAAHEDDTFVPARIGLAEAWLARGQVTQGIQELRAALAAAGEQPEASGAWAADLARGRKRLSELEAAEVAAAAKLAKHVEASLALAAKWAGKDPDLARGILTRVLRLDPKNAEAQRLLPTLGEGTGPWVSLFNGRNAAGWQGFGAEFKVVDGVVEGDVGPDGKAIVTEEKHSGDFDFRGELRMVSAHGEPMLLALFLLRSRSDLTTYGCAEQKLRLDDEAGGERTPAFRLGFAELDPPLDPAAWNRFELRLRGGTVTCWLNGKQVGEGVRREPSVPVQLGVRLQQGKAQFRALEVRQP